MSDEIPENMIGAKSLTMDKDEFRAIENLAWMVKHSKQNVGNRMLDAAESVIKICNSKKPENSEVRRGGPDR